MSDKPVGPPPWLTLVSSAYRRRALCERPGRLRAGSIIVEANRDSKTVETLPAKIEESIAEDIRAMGLKKLSLLTARRNLQLTAKAAVAVYEGVLENQRGEECP
jgi:hypothetical protein